ncbi:hypothetical protein BB561_004068 [Smittium simulii]|uniref:leucine--tRNA ligase n=1 Tax=Smittium simulii TaxID=133385 RepID=A0A2T9YI94_9FUNG|nr:hypothetical protein BB561_004068 [Smittium simulii]
MADIATEPKTSKRDALRNLETIYQKKWQDAKIYEKEAPKCSSENEDDWKKMHDTHPKYMATFPFPYMNGSLHLGHSFSFSKAEFAVRWEQLKGKNALFPFGLHATGMPIRASADKISREIELFGIDFAKFFEQQTELGQALNQIVISKDQPKPAAAPLYQFQIMQSIGFDLSEIHKFADPSHWLETFPPLAIRDVSNLGCCVDWRRSFVTTDYNPYFDSFARWQFQRLRDLGKIKFGKRLTIWSTKDGQPCMDHDRQSGEGVGPQEYTAIKMKVLNWGEASKNATSSPNWAVSADADVYLVAATLRPETMYGQTNCYVGVNIKYGAYEATNGQIYITTERAAKNMAFQGNSKIPDQISYLGSILGSELIGTKVRAPNSSYDSVYVLPMDNVLPTKGTGVVTSVPSDSPADFVALRDLQRKPDFFKIQSSWVEGFVPIDIIKSEQYGLQTAAFLVESLKIQSQKDVNQIEQAKDLGYKDAFFNSTMNIGKYKGMAVQDAKPLIRDDMIAAGDAFAYAEPEGSVVSRSGDDCIVALCDQWYFDYGEKEWRDLVFKYLEKMDTGSIETRHQFKKTLDWLKQWACARSFGLGSKVPWDDSILIESLSDSTIYMAYYTVSHLLHPQTLNGSDIGPLGITIEDMDYAAWDYIFQGKPLPDNHSKFNELKELRKSFLYWYPMNLRTSGKDLIPNHLTFCLYNHAALFDEDEQPLAIHGNGHLMLNGTKMSKSTGNFMTLADAIEKYGADATRISLADAGDGLEDANFEMTTANASILRLYTTLEWIMSIYQVTDGLQFSKTEAMNLRDSDSPLNLFDKVFLAMVDRLTISTFKAYDSAMFRAGLKSGFYEMLSARDWYRDTTTVSGINMHRQVLHKFVERFAALMLPITPHWSEHIWTHILKNETSIVKYTINANEFNNKETLDVIEKYTAIGEYIKKLTKSIRDAELLVIKQSKSKKLKSISNFDPSLPKSLTIITCSVYPKWQESIVNILKENYNVETEQFDDVNIRASLGKSGMLKDKKTMPFANEIKKTVNKNKSAAFERSMTFEEVDVIEKLKTYISSSFNYQNVEIVSTTEESEAKNATPGTPSFVIANI